MLFVENSNTDPYCNHATEEWLMDNYQEDCFMLWRNQKAILLGRNQNAYSEINMGYAKEHDIKIVRRITGGGTVLTDAGNIMFSFIDCGGKRDFIDFRKFTKPILSALNSLGVPAEFSGRNDLTIKGCKFSGNAQCLYNGKLLHHGTLLYNADTTELSRALNVSKLKLISKGVSSVESRVTNISSHMREQMDIEDFRSYLFNYVMGEANNPALLRLTEEQWLDIRAKADKKHATNEWIFGLTPPFNIEREEKLPSGIIQVYLHLVRGRIVRAKIYGDFFGDRDMLGIENVLIGLLYEENEIRNALLSMPINEYFSGISLDELVYSIIKTD